MRFAHCSFSLLVALGLLSSSTFAQSKQYSTEELAQARTYIQTKMDPAVREQLVGLAKKSGKNPEELFLEIRAMTMKDRTLGGEGADPNIPIGQEKN